MCHIAQCFWAGVAQGRWTGRRMCVKEAVSQPENNKELNRLQVRGERWVRFHTCRVGRGKRGWCQLLEKLLSLVE